jgi:hypothetical protein
MNSQIQAPGNHLMQKRISAIGGFTFLALVLMSAASLHGETPLAPGAVAEIRQGLPQGPHGLTVADQARPVWVVWNADSGHVAMPWLLAQNQQPPATGPDKSAGEEKLDLDDQVIRDVLEPLQRGMEGHDFYQVLSVFDQQGMTDYAQLRDRMRAFFAQYEAIRFRYQLLQVTSDKNRGSAVAEIEMEATPGDPSQMTLRRDTQMRLRMNLVNKGWRVVAFAPADFFAQ